MNGKDLMESMGYVDEKYIADAETPPARRRLHWQPMIAAAACLVLVLTGVWQFLPRQQAEDAAPMVSAALYQKEAAAGGTARTVEDAVEEAAAEATAADQDTGAVAMMVSALAEMTVRVVERGEDALVCLVTDPGTSDYQVNDQVKIALPDANSQAEAEQADAGEGTLYRVSFLPDQGAEFINPAQWLPLEDE